jgi:hypothetical protein
VFEMTQLSNINWTEGVVIFAGTVGKLLNVYLLFYEPMTRANIQRSHIINSEPCINDADEHHIQSTSSQIHSKISSNGSDMNPIHHILKQSRVQRSHTSMNPNLLSAQHSTRESNPVQMPNI